MLYCSKVGADIKRGQPCHSARLLGVFMTFSDWMVPELSISAAVELENSKRIIRTHAQQQPEKVVDLACSAMEQAFLYQSIMRKATQRIAELEMTMLLSPPAAPADQSDRTCVGCVCAFAQLPWLVRLLIRPWLDRIPAA